MATIVYALLLAILVFWAVLLCSAAGHLSRHRGWLRPSPPAQKEG